MHSVKSFKIAGYTLLIVIHLLLHFTGRLGKVFIDRGKILSDLCKLDENCFKLKLFVIMKSGVSVCVVVAKET